MFNNMIFYTVFGLPAVAWGGIVTLSCLLFTATIPVLNQKGINKIPIEWHYIMAKVTIALALIHGALGILAFI